ncbi:MAG TPA: glycosyltransferase family 4 protein [Rhodothermales bacterium]
MCTTHPIQYQAPLWRALAGRRGFRVKVFFGCDMSVRGYRDTGFGSAVKWDVPLTEGYDSEFLSSDPDIHHVGFMKPDGRGLEAALRRFAPNVTLVTAYNGAFYLRALRAARKLGSSVVMRHEATDSAFDRGFLKSRIRDFVLRAVYSRVDRFAAIGTNAERHLLRLGVRRERIGRSPYCVDSDFVAAQMALWGPRRLELRAELEICPNDTALLFSGKLISKKDPLLIAAALQQLPSHERLQTHVIIAGAGELRASLEVGLRKVIGNRAHFLGFLNQSEIGRAYATADYLILPSKRGAGETWGLVVNEAMQFGVPAIVSNAVGCSPDLIVHGETGWVFPAGDSDTLAEVLRPLIAEFPKGSGTLSDSAQRRVARFSLGQAVDGLVATIDAAARQSAS